MECIKLSKRNDSSNNSSDLGLNSKVNLKMSNGILVRFCPKTQGTVAEIMGREMEKVIWWAAIFEDTRSGP